MDASPADVSAEPVGGEAAGRVEAMLQFEEVTQVR